MLDAHPPPMRSRTLPGLPGRCPRCYLKQGLCLCSLVPTVQTRMGFVVVRHVLEGFKSTNTARIAALALPGCEVVDFEGRDPALDARLRALPRPMLLFPDGSPTPPSEPPSHLIILDGTWRQVRRMLRRIEPLGRFPTLSVPAPAQAPRRLRHSPHPEALSTFEAMTAAVGYFEGEEAARPLAALHDEMVERVLKGRGTLKMDASLESAGRLTVSPTSSER